MAVTTSTTGTPPYTKAQLVQLKAAVKHAQASVNNLTHWISKATVSYKDNKTVWKNYSGNSYADSELMVLFITKAQLEAAWVVNPNGASDLKFYFHLDPFAKKEAVTGKPPANKNLVAGFGFTLSNLSSALDEATKKLTAAKKAYDDAVNSSNKYDSNVAANTKSGKADAKALAAAVALGKKLANQPTVYNVSAVSDAYLLDRKVYKVDASGNIADATYFGNAPKHVDTAADLWSQAIGNGANKGMMQTWYPPDGWQDGITTSSNTGIPNTINPVKYGFQFLYNPTTISMTYMGTSQVDVAYQMSGNDKTNYIPAANSTGTVSFSIPLNRTFDLQYYDSNGICLNTEKYVGRKPYGSEGTQHNLFDEQAAIYNKGTMYDVEFLLRTLIGFTVTSELRGGELTADMGIFARRPIELHLGPEMRYRGYVSALNVNHVMFNERMVPIMSSLSITFNRYPDYAAAKKSKK
jgi:hypothetical protein